MPNEEAIGARFRSIGKFDKSRFDTEEDVDDDIVEDIDEGDEHL